MGFFRKHRRMTLALVLVVGVVAGFDLVMAALAWWELRGAADADPWLTTDRRFAPSGPERGRTVVLVHGFVGSPFDMEPLVAPLREQGFAVFAPVVLGQNRNVSAYSRGSVTGDELVAWLRGIVAAETERSGRPPFVVGFSMGGTLAALLAAEGGIDEVVLIAPWFALPTADGLLTGVVRALAPVVPLVPKPWKGRIDDPEGYERYETGSALVSLRAFLTLDELGDRARARAPEIDVPLLVLTGPGDAVASHAAIHETFGSHPKARIVDLPRSNHVVLYDYDRNLAIEEILRFLTRE